MGRLKFSVCLLILCFCNLPFVLIFAKEEPWFPAKEGYTFMQSVGEESLVHGTRGPATKKECEVSY